MDPSKSFANGNGPNPGSSYGNDSGLNGPIRPIDLIGAQTHWWWMV